jgi:hypothetical protein
LEPSRCAVLALICFVQLQPQRVQLAMQVPNLSEITEAIAQIDFRYKLTGHDHKVLPNKLNQDLDMMLLASVSIMFQLTSDRLESETL